MLLEFSGELWFWKGPSPFHFVTVPEAAVVRRAESLDLGDHVSIRLTVDV